MLVRLLVKLRLFSGWLSDRRVFITNEAQGREIGMRSRDLFSAFHPSGRNSNVASTVEFI